MAGDTLDLPLYKEYAPLCIPAQDHYICEDGRIKCLPGWQGDLCQVNYAKSAKLSKIQFIWLVAALYFLSTTELEMSEDGQNVQWRQKARKTRIHSTCSCFPCIEEGRGQYDCLSSQDATKTINMGLWVISWRELGEVMEKECWRWQRICWCVEGGALSLCTNLLTAPLPTFVCSKQKASDRAVWAVGN
jgi:hypothetical protein